MNKTHKQQLELELEGIEIMTREGIQHFENQIKKKQTGTRGHSANALDGIQTRAMGWTVGLFFFFLNQWFWKSCRRSRSANGQRQPDGRRARWNLREWTHLQVVMLEGEAHARNTILESEIAF